VGNTPINPRRDWNRIDRVLIVTVRGTVDDHLTFVNAVVDVVEPILALGIESRLEAPRVNVHTPTQLEIHIAKLRIAVAVIARKLVQTDLIFSLDAAEEREQGAEEE
jgi:hypothetical protein